MNALINIDVPALKPAIDFYCNALGLYLIRMMDDDVAELDGAAVRIYLLQKPAGSNPGNDQPQGRQYTRHWTPVHIDFVVADLAEATNQAIAAGAQKESECVEWNGSRCITFSDPFGHGFCLIEFDAETYIEDKTH